MTIDIIEMAKAEANAKVIADMDKAQASFIEARTEKRKAEEISTQPAPHCSKWSD
jgi:hypothetical protein